MRRAIRDPAVIEAWNRLYMKVEHQLRPWKWARNATALLAVPAVIWLPGWMAVVILVAHVATTFVINNKRHALLHCPHCSKPVVPSWSFMSRDAAVGDWCPHCMHWLTAPLRVAHRRRM